MGACVWGGVWGVCVYGCVCVCVCVRVHVCLREHILCVCVHDAFTYCGTVCTCNSIFPLF